MSTLAAGTAEKYARLQTVLRDLGRVAVAFSGGVDSTLLLQVAADTLGADRVLALIGESSLTPARETAEARQLAAAIGAPFKVVHGDMLGDARVAANPSDRCYYCKSLLFARFAALARDAGFPVLVDGANADDTGDWRPGQQAARELGARSPLQEVGLTKAEVRELSRMLGLPTWTKPSYACLASRIPYGTPISAEILGAIEAAEECLHALGFAQCRVRHHGDLARIEVLPDDLPRLLDADLRAHLTARLRELGYHYITVDLQGYRTGSMNEVL